MVGDCSEDPDLNLLNFITMQQATEDGDPPWVDVAVAAEAWGKEDPALLAAEAGEGSRPIQQVTGMQRLGHESCTHWRHCDLISHPIPLSSF